MTNQDDAELVPVELHQGRALVSAMSSYYSLLAALKECVQNSIDNGATLIRVVVNYRDSFAAVYGNGDGCSPDGFKEALRSVFYSLKGKTKKKYGRFGIGLFAPTDKCKTYRFVALNRKTSLTSAWTFRKEDIEPCERVHIPRHDVKPIGNGFTTACVMDGLIKDKGRMACTSAELAADIRTEFSVMIAECSIRIDIHFTNEEGVVSSEVVSELAFAGERLEDTAYGHGENNRADFYLTLAPIEGGKRSGQVLCSIADDLFRLPLLRVLERVSDASLPADLKKALSQGVFSGVIVSTGCELNENRRSWRKNQALTDFCGFVCMWWNEVGSAYYDEIKTSAEESRWQDLGEKALADFARTLSDPTLSEYYKSLGKFKVGSVGEQHVDVDPSAALGQQDVNSIEVRPEREGKGKAGSKDPEKESLGHKPMTVTGTRGQKRTLVKDNSLGIQITFSEMPGSSRMYRLDSVTGILEINIRHPHWESLEKSDDALVAYQTMCLFHAMVGHATAEDQESYYRTSVVPFMNLWVVSTRLSS